MILGETQVISAQTQVIPGQAQVIPGQSQIVPGHVIVIPADKVSCVCSSPGAGSPHSSTCSTNTVLESSGVQVDTGYLLELLHRAALPLPPLPPTPPLPPAPPLPPTPSFYPSQHLISFHSCISSSPTLLSCNPCISEDFPSPGYNSSIWRIFLFSELPPPILLCSSSV